tara:strand:+ start:181 stop:561 length:381 start_codon:yes stop_codon:yes gene_type:complete
MYVTNLQTGAEVLFNLHSSLPAYPVRENNVVIYKTGRQYKKAQEVPLTEGEGTVILNDSKVLVLRFSARTNPSFQGVAEIDYNALKSLYVYGGETNAATVAAGLNNKQTAPAMKIYRNKVILRWAD